MIIEELLTGVKLRIQLQYGKTWTRKKLRIWTFFTQCKSTNVHRYTQERILVNSGKHDNKLAILTGNIFSSVPEFVNTVLAAYNPLAMFT